MANGRAAGFAGVPFTAAGPDGGRVRDARGAARIRGSRSSADLERYRRGDGSVRRRVLARAYSPVSPLRRRCSRARGPRLRRAVGDRSAPDVVAARATDARHRQAPVPRNAQRRRSRLAGARVDRSTAGGGGRRDRLGRLGSRLRAPDRRRAGPSVRTHAPLAHAVAATFVERTAFARPGSIARRAHRVAVAASAVPGRAAVGGDALADRTPHRRCADGSGDRDHRDDAGRRRGAGPAVACPRRPRDRRTARAERRSCAAGANGGRPVVGRTRERVRLRADG